MTTKNTTVVTYLRNPSLKTYNSPFQLAQMARNSSQYQQSVKKSSLVFLSTLMQAEKSFLTDLNNF